MNIYQIVLLAYFTLGIVGTILVIGRKREPLSCSTAAIAVAIALVMCVLVVLA